ncbi:MAG: DUF1214 domain-containing protein [Deltaproteobacteria bacterium]|nr:DUF1214 domain-containing protein [Deltaproteobacteria bacterium]
MIPLRPSPHPEAFPPRSTARTRSAQGRLETAALGVEAILFAAIGLVTIGLAVNGLAPSRAAAAGMVDAVGAEREAATPAPQNAEWIAFCERLKSVGGEILRADLPASELDRAEGQRYLLQRLSATIDEALDAESGPPIVSLYSHKLRKYGLDSADAKYMTARIEGAGTYRLYGTLGTAHHIAFQLTTSRAGWQSFESLSRDEIGADASGQFEILISPERPESWKKAWLRLDPRSTELLLREYFYDWENERPSEFSIERVDRAGESVPLDAAATTVLFDQIADQFAATVPKWLAPSLDDRIHRVNQLRPPAKSATEGLRENAYGSGWFRLEPDQALLIELDPPRAHLWSFELGSFWWQSLDYVEHTSSLNGFQAVRSSDGRYRLIVALEDPGVPNWLDPVGHREGVILYRYQLEEGANTAPTARLVLLEELKKLLPADTPRVDRAAREAEIAMHRRHAARRWAP